MSLGPLVRGPTNYFEVKAEHLKPNPLQVFMKPSFGSQSETKVVELVCGGAQLQCKNKVLINEAFMS
jgi:hypothetical protein